jgi:hypothetical protein
MPRTPYNEHHYLRPGVNGEFLLWLVLLGVPALMLFLVYTKTDQLPDNPVPAPASGHEQNLNQPPHSDR